MKSLLFVWNCKNEVTRNVLKWGWRVSTDASRSMPQYVYLSNFRYTIFGNQLKQVFECLVAIEMPRRNVLQLSLLDFIVQYTHVVTLTSQWQIDQAIFYFLILFSTQQKWTDVIILDPYMAPPSHDKLYECNHV